MGWSKLCCSELPACLVFAYWCRGTVGSLVCFALVLCGHAQRRTPLWLDASTIWFGRARLRRRSDRFIIRLVYDVSYLSVIALGAASGSVTVGAQ